MAVRGIPWQKGGYVTLSSSAAFGGQLLVGVPVVPMCPPLITCHSGKDTDPKQPEQRASPVSSRALTAKQTAAGPKEPPLSLADGRRVASAAIRLRRLLRFAHISLPRTLRCAHGVSAAANASGLPVDFGFEHPYLLFNQSIRE